MTEERKRQWRSRILVGGGLGTAAYLLLFPGTGGTSMLSAAFWFALGAETAVATLSFAEERGALLRRSGSTSR